MRPTEIAVLFDHLYWMRDRILEAADNAAVSLTGTDHATIRDLRTTLVHELDVEWSWRERLRGPDPTQFAPDDEELEPEDFPSIAAIRGRWSEDEAAMRTWLATLDDAALGAPCRAEADAGRHPFWFHLQHLYTHAIQQFSDCAVLLTASGRSPGELDFLDFALERERRTARGEP